MKFLTLVSLSIIQKLQSPIEAVFSRDWRLLLWGKLPAVAYVLTTHSFYRIEDQTQEYILQTTITELQKFTKRYTGPIKIAEF